MYADSRDLESISFSHGRIGVNCSIPDGTTGRRDKEGRKQDSKPQTGSTKIVRVVHSASDDTAWLRGAKDDPIASYLC